MTLSFAARTASEPLAALLSVGVYKFWGHQCLNPISIVAARGRDLQILEHRHPNDWVHSVKACKRKMKKDCLGMPYFICQQISRYFDEARPHCWLLV
jgi:hypothetical protein